MADEHAAERWEERNNAYLAAQLDYLRARLQALAHDRRPTERLQVDDEQLTLPTVESEPDARSEPEPTRRRWFWRRRAEVRAGADRPSPAPPAPASAPQHAELAAEPLIEMPPLQQPGEHDPAQPVEMAPALVELGDRLALTTFEREVLLLAAATELDPGVGALCGAALGIGAEAAPTFGLALRLFDEPEWEALAPHRPLRRLQLVALGGAGGSVVHAPLRADERVVNLLKGLDHLDERLVELLAPMAAGAAEGPIAGSHVAIVERIARRARAAGAQSILVSLIGSCAASKRIVAERVAAELGAYVVRLPAVNLPPPGAELARIMRLWERDALLSPLILYLDAFDEAGDLPPESVMAARRLLNRANGLVFLDTREAWRGLGGTALVIEVPNPSAREQQAAWESALPDARSVAPDLAAHFDLDPVAIRALATSGAENIWEEVRDAQRPSLDLLGHRAQATVEPERLVLPDDIVAQLERIKDQVRHRMRVYHDWGLAAHMSRGLGISALFAGESGVGKTLAAEVIAADLRLDLYRIDLSGVVSKYIGETEKNLRRVFDAAEQGGVILCFDEADALFGKRSEVKDSHDRYANIEVNYLLQRMEEYRGLAILTTNMKTALDHAFTRRIRFIVDFPFPGPEDRERLWHGAFIPGLDTSRLDFGRLAQLTLSGGGIHNVAVNATFAAAATPERAVTMPMVLDAARLEYRKNDLPVNEAAFAWREPVAALAP